MTDSQYLQSIVSAVDSTGQDIKTTSTWSYVGITTRGSKDYLTWASEIGEFQVNVVPSGIIYSFRPKKKKLGNHGSGGLGPIRYSGNRDEDLGNLYEIIHGVVEYIEGQWFGNEHGSPEPEAAPEPERQEKAQTWRDAKTENEIIRLFPFRPKSDDIIDLVQKAREMKSNKLINLAKERSSRVESLTPEKQAEALVNQLLDSDGPPKPTKFGFKVKDGLISFKRKKK